MSNVIHQMGDALRSAVAAVTPVTIGSQFKEKGQLTCDEFVEAGDQLVQKFPSWQWQAAHCDFAKSHLPKQKQFLITRNVPCTNRVLDLDTMLNAGAQDEDGFCLPAMGSDGEEQDGVEEIGGPYVAANTTSNNSGIAPADVGGCGLGAFIIENHTDQLNVASSGYSSVACRPQCVEQAPPMMNEFADIDDLLQAEKAPQAQTVVVGDSDGLDARTVRHRTYDLSITWDKYYQTPRMWLFGYDESGIPLSPRDVFQDILTEYAEKTVTIDPHPCTGLPTASIHPCKHALVMKKVVDGWVKSGVEVRHDLALFVFLKFISGVIPTINYDFTMDIELK